MKPRILQEKVLEKLVNLSAFQLSAAVQSESLRVQLVFTNQKCSDQMKAVPNSNRVQLV